MESSENKKPANLFKWVCRLVFLFSRVLKPLDFRLCFVADSFKISAMPVNDEAGQDSDNYDQREILGKQRVNERGYTS